MNAEQILDFPSGILSQIQETIYTGWLDGPLAVGANKNKAIHWGAIATSALISWALDPSKQKYAIGASGRASKGFELLNIAASIFADPNLEGIPIKAETQKCSREVDVSHQMIISQEESSGGAKQYITDNAAPHPREWTITGYLQSISLIDGMTVIKPTLQMQIALLDFYSASRRPLWFKAHYSSFFHVLIEHFDYEFAPNVQNSVHVNLVLSEYVTNKAYSDIAGERVAEPVPEGTSTLDIHSILVR